MFYEFPVISLLHILRNSTIPCFLLVYFLCLYYQEPNSWSRSQKGYMDLSVRDESQQVCKNPDRQNSIGRIEILIHIY